MYKDTVIPQMPAWQAWQDSQTRPDAEYYCALHAMKTLKLPIRNLSSKCFFGGKIKRLLLIPQNIA